jgi:ABC-type multidrug transport system ATPase subunit
MTAIEINGLSVRRGSELVLDSVNPAVEESAVFGLFGPSDAGKSTLLELLTGRERPTEGYLRVSGPDPIDEGDRVHERTGVLPERVDLDARLSGWERLHNSTGGTDAPADPVDLLTASASPGAP